VSHPLDLETLMSGRSPHFAVSVILFCMRRLTLAFIFFALFSFVADANADAAAEIKIGVLKFGTLSWVLDTIRHNGLDKAEGIELEVVPLASTRAAKEELQNGSLDLIISDWLWVSRERSLGKDFTFSPFSTELGAVMVPPASPIRSLDDLRGKMLGVAGGPIDKSWLILVAYTLRVAFFDLRTATTPVFGTAPLLADEAVEHKLDAVLEYWPYAARLDAKGFSRLIAIEDLPLELGARGRVAMVGYVFSDAWAKANPTAIEGFLRAADRADEQLASSDAEWERIRPLMNAEDDATFEALKRYYREGIPHRSVPENEVDAEVLYQFLRVLGGEKLVGPGVNLAPGTFWKYDSN
jgi:NitT/TauT family transport system substrate-binding protein